MSFHTLPKHMSTIQKLFWGDRLKAQTLSSFLLYTHSGQIGSIFVGPRYLRTALKRYSPEVYIVYVDKTICNSILHNIVSVSIFLHFISSTLLYVLQCTDMYFA
jgi:hypothetical protein